MSEQAYLSQLRQIQTMGRDVVSRNAKTRRIIGMHARYDLRRNFPAVTTKKLQWHSVKAELFWFLRGSTSARELNALGSKIWDAWADERGELGPIYGEQWRNVVRFEPAPLWGDQEFDQIDQIQQLLEGLRENPNGRRHIVSAWNVGQIDEMALPPCHAFFQCFVDDGRVSLMLHQRSGDMFLGVPFNIASYSLLVHLLARHCGYGVGEFIHNIGDAHIYDNHKAQVELQLSRTIRPAPTLAFDDDLPTDLFELVEGPEDKVKERIKKIRLVGYDPHPAIKAEVTT